MPRHPADQPESNQQRRDQKQEGPRRQNDRFDEFPTEDRLRGDGQREEERRFAIAKQVGVGYHQIAQEQQAE